MDDPENRHRVVVALAHGADGTPCIIVGIPEKGWEYMKDGKAHDIAVNGITAQPVNLLILRGQTQEDILNTLRECAGFNETSTDNLKKIIGIPSPSKH